jgi:hypothetical protein
MKRSKFTDSQIVEALKRVDAGLAVPEICRELGISTVTFYKWRAIMIIITDIKNVWGFGRFKILEYRVN